MLTCTASLLKGILLLPLSVNEMNAGPLPNVVLVGTRNADAVLDGIHFSIHADC